MPIRRIEIISCDLCQDEQQSDLIPKLPKPADWIVLRIADPKDGRAKLERVVCKNCLAAIDRARPVPMPDALSQEA